jgi:hypothetical protein
MRPEIFSKTAIRYLAAALVLAALLLPPNISPVAAQDISEYFDISYEPITFSQTDIYGYEEFHAEVQGSATCIKDLDLPIPVTGFRLKFKVIAEHEGGGGQVTLNSSYTITISPLPVEAGDYAEIDESIPLKFPGGSQSGVYDVLGELIKAEAKVYGFWQDVEDYIDIPPEYRTLAMDGPVTYTAPPNSAPDTPHTPSPADDATGVSPPVTLSVAVSDPDDDAMTVTFFDASDDSIIDTDAGVPSGSRAQISWSGLDGAITYSWYAEASDGEFGTQSGTWSFTTAPPNTAPNEPGNPSPADHATGVSIDANLSWTKGDPDAGDTVTSDVYFGTSTTPPLVSDNRVSTSYEPGTLSPNTKYYWYIVAADNHGASTTGPLWDFTTGSAPNNAPQLSSPSVLPNSGTPSTDFYYYVTYYDSDGDSPSVMQVYIDDTPHAMSLCCASCGTYRYGPGNLSEGDHNYYFYFEDGKGGTARLPASGSYPEPVVTPPNSPPDTPGNPSPADHATGISVDADLGWTGGDPDPGDTVTYDVCFGTAATPPQVSENQTGTSYDPGLLSYNTTYYWKITAKDNHGAPTTGDLWDFTTGAEPGAGTAWIFPSTSAVFLGPTPANGRPYLDATVLLPTGTEPPELSGVYWLDEPTGGWQYFIPGFGGSTLTSLESGQSYLLAVSGPCSWNLPCGEGTPSPAGNTWNFAPTSAVFLGPTPANGRPYLDAAVPLPTGTEPPELSGVYWLDEPTGGWQYFIPGYGGSTLTSLQPGQAYLVAVSGPCSWNLP